MIVDFREIGDDGDNWESFTRDFLVELGLLIETPPSRGPDAGRDLLVLEGLTGPTTSHSFRWLVSCKHKALSGRSVSEDDERNILERVQSFAADGFMGVYSTVPSSGLTRRLEQLVHQTQMREFKILDGRLIENYLVRLGYSKLMMRYLPESYRRVKPRHLISSEYVPLQCARCSEDLLEQLDQGGRAILAYVVTADDFVDDIYWAHKGECDTRLEEEFERKGLFTRWEDISDLEIPAWYMRDLFTTMNILRDRGQTYSDQAFEKLKHFYYAIAQKVLREMTEKERERVTDLLSIPFGL